MSYIITLISAMLVGIFAGVISHILFKRDRLTVWAFIAGIAPEWPNIFLAPLGVTGLENLLFLTHTAGIFLFPVILVIIDITLIELGMTSILKPFNSYLPDKLKSLIKLEYWVEKFEKKGILPTPARISSVYLIGVFAGTLNIGIDLLLKL